MSTENDWLQMERQVARLNEKGITGKHREIHRHKWVPINAREQECLDCDATRPIR